VKLKRDEESRIESALERGRQEGAKEALIQGIRSHQRILGRPVSSLDDLGGMSSEALKKLNEDLDQALIDLLARNSQNNNAEKT
jgi:hypothetical protein